MSTDEYQPADIVLVKQEAAVGGNRKLQKLPYDRYARNTTYSKLL
jgi:hypothetical protein